MIKKYRIMCSMLGNIDKRVAEGGKTQLMKGFNKILKINQVKSTC